MFCLFLRFSVAFVGSASLSLVRCLTLLLAAPVLLLLLSRTLFRTLAHCSTLQPVNSAQNCQRRICSSARSFPDLDSRQPASSSVGKGLNGRVVLVCVRAPHSASLPGAALISAAEQHSSSSAHRASVGRRARQSFMRLRPSSSCVCVCACVCLYTREQERRANDSSSQRKRELLSLARCCSACRQLVSLARP